MKTAEEIITLLEQDFYYHHNQMDDKAIKLKIAEKDSNTFLIRQYQGDVCEEANLCCYICDVLSDIKGTTSGDEMNRLYTKFDLWKDEE